MTLARNHQQLLSGNKPVGSDQFAVWDLEFFNWNLI
jgi:hypothetical protein